MYKLLIQILLILVGTFFGAYSGANGTSKGWRRFGIPGIIMLYAYFSLHNPYVITTMLMSFILALGYGIPNFDCKGGRVGQFFYKYFPYDKNNINDKKRDIVNILTRGTLGLLLMVSIICIPIINKNWGLFTISIIINSSIFALLSWQDMGVITIKKLNKKILISDIVIYGLLMINILVLI
jgi:hypothetical protein